MTPSPDPIPTATPLTLLERLAREAHGKGYADSPHVFYAGPGIHDEARYEPHPFASCPAPDCVEARSALAARQPVVDGVLDVERLYQAHNDVESNYIHTPDRHSRAYWQKIADRYAHPSELSALSVRRLR